VIAWYPKLLLVSMALLLLSGCSGKKVTTKVSSQLGKYHIRTIALIPFQTMTTPQVIELSGPSFPVPSGARRSDMSVAVPSTTDQYVRPTRLVPPAAGEKITELMWSKLKARPGLEFLSPNETAGAARELTGGDAPATASADKIAQRLSADAALSGKVLVYQERVGGRLGADPPAAVGFEVKLVASDGMVLWEGNYYEKQRPMIEDFLGFIQRYGMFVTAEELAAYGAAELAQAFPFGTATD
jgi:hypothetical protein